MLPARFSSRRAACRSGRASETSPTAPPAPAATPSGACRTTLAAMATVLPPITLLMTATTVAKAMYCRWPQRARRHCRRPPPVDVTPEQEEPRLVAGDLLVVETHAVDRHAVPVVLSTALDHSDEGEDSDHVEGGQHDEGDSSKVRSDLAEMADQRGTDVPPGSTYLDVRRSPREGPRTSPLAASTTAWTKALGAGASGGSPYVATETRLRKSSSSVVSTPGQLVLGDGQSGERSTREAAWRSPP